MLRTAEHSQHLWAGSADANTHEIGVAAFVIKHQEERLMPERSGTDLHPTNARKAVFDRNGKMAGLLGLDEHLGGQLCKLI